MSDSTSPIDWARAERVAIAIANRHRSAGTDWTSVQAPAATADIENAIEAVTGLRPRHGSAQVRFVDRPEWIRANLDSFRTMLAPLLDRWADRGASSRTGTSVDRKSVV